mmetsp:Transcript_28597/g.98698  ORF Transcript_28597/g.98698 Transcript_28597/m.98698 type:complete len:128 (+) Transcript_28597:678-1061(+)
MVTVVFTMLRALIVHQVAQLNKAFGLGFAAYSLSSEPGLAKADDELDDRGDDDGVIVLEAITAESPKSKAPLPPTSRTTELHTRSEYPSKQRETMPVRTSALAKGAGRSARHDASGRGQNLQKEGHY